MIGAQLMKEEFYRGGPVLHLLLRYTQPLITQLVQTILSINNYAAGCC